MVDYRKAIVSLTIAILFVFFVQASIQVVSQSPDYSDYCDTTYPDRNNFNNSEFDEQVKQYEQENEECRSTFDKAQDKHAMFVFYVSAVAALIVIFIALKLPTKEDVVAMISSGLLIGGLITLFYGTSMGWQGINLYLRPLVLLFELILVIYLAYVTMRTKKSGSKKK